MVRSVHGWSRAVRVLSSFTVNVASYGQRDSAAVTKKVFRWGNELLTWADLAPSRAPPERGRGLVNMEVDHGVAGGRGREWTVPCGLQTDPAAALTPSSFKTRRGPRPAEPREGPEVCGHLPPRPQEASAHGDGLRLSVEPPRLPGPQRLVASAARCPGGVDVPVSARPAVGESASPRWPATRSDFVCSSATRCLLR